MEQDLKFIWSPFKEGKIRIKRWAGTRFWFSDLHLWLAPPQANRLSQDPGFCEADGVLRLLLQSLLQTPDPFSIAADPPPIILPHTPFDHWSSVLDVFSVFACKVHPPTEENIVFLSPYLDNLGCTKAMILWDKGKTKSISSGEWLHLAKLYLAAGGWTACSVFHSVCQEQRHCGMEQSTSPCPCLQKCPKCSL